MIRFTRYKGMLKEGWFTLWLIFFFLHCWFRFVLIANSFICRCRRDDAPSFNGGTICVRVSPSLYKTLDGSPSRDSGPYPRGDLPDVLTKRLPRGDHTLSSGTHRTTHIPEKGQHVVFAFPFLLRKYSTNNIVRVESVNSFSFHIS